MRLKLYYIVLFYTIFFISCEKKDDLLTKKRQEYYIAVTSMGVIIKIDKNKKTTTELKKIKKEDVLSFNDVDLNSAILIDNDVYVAYHTQDKNSLFQLKIIKYNLIKNTSNTINITLPNTIEDKNNWFFTSFDRVDKNKAIAIISNKIKSNSKILKIDLTNFYVEDLNISFKSNDFKSSIVTKNKFYYGSSPSLRDKKRTGIGVIDLTTKNESKFLLKEQPYYHKLTLKNNNTIIALSTFGDHKYNISEINLDNHKVLDVFKNQKGFLGSFPDSGGRGFYDKENDLYVIASYSYSLISQSEEKYKLEYFLNEYNLNNKKNNVIKFSSDILMKSVILGKFSTP